VQRGWQGARKGGGRSESGLRHGVDARPGSDAAPTCRDKLVKRCPLQGEVDAGERVI
jgi:hypothetical protein